MSIVLNSARIVRGPGQETAEAAVPSKQLDDVVSIKAAADDSNGSSSTAFTTDAEIGKRGGYGPARCRSAPHQGSRQAQPSCCSGRSPSPPESAHCGRRLC